MTTQHWSLRHRMQSLRWRLPLTYAAVVLLTVFILAVTLLVALDRYYAIREEGYLIDTAHAMQRVLVPILEDDYLTEEYLEQALGTMSFFGRSQVRVYDTEGEILAEALITDRREFNVTLGPNTDSIIGAATIAENWLETEAQTVPIQIERIPSESKHNNEDGEGGGRVNDPRGPISFSMWAFDVPFGYAIFDDPQNATTTTRSNQVVTMRIMRDDETLGLLELSEGPAFGTEVINSVVRRLGVAALLAIPASVLIGWAISRSISRPVLLLTDATQQMAGGELSTRVTMPRNDEIGTLAATFNTMADQIEQTIRTLEQFVADAAHEIKTPITSIRTNLELAAGGITDANSLSDLALAQKELRRLEKLTNSLLALARLESDTGEAASEPVDISTLVRQVHENYASRAEQAGITMHVTTPKSPVVVAGNPEHIIRLLENLVDNAVKFTPEDGTVTIALNNRDTHTAYLTVSDTGIGIPPNDLSKLFSRFHRGRNTANYPGSGLGLVIAKTIAEDHGGSISVESAPSGTCFMVTLPTQPDEETTS